MTQAATNIPAVAQIPDAARRTGLVERSIFCLFVAGLAWVPFWHGSNEAITWGVNAVFFPGLAVLYEAGLVLRGKPHPVGLRYVLLPATLFLLLVLWIALQSTAGLFADAVNPVWEMAGDAVGMSLAGSISVNRDLTAAALLRLITGASVFWLALQLCRDAARARALVAAIALIGAVYAGYGLIAAKTGWLRMLEHAAKRRRVGDIHQSQFLCGVCRDRVHRDGRGFPAAMPAVRHRRFRHFPAANGGVGRDDRP